MNRFKVYVTIFVVLLLTVLFFGCEEENQPPVGQPQWISLFNGQNLDGWQPKITGYPLGENYNNTFRAEDGVLKVMYDKYEKFEGQFGHLFYKDSFSHYRLRLEYRFIGEQVPEGPGWAFRNSGIMLHCQKPETMAVNQNFPVCLEAQLLGGDGENPRSTGNLCTPGTHVVMDGQLVTNHCISSTSETYHGDQWVTVEVEVRGGESIKHIVEGETVMHYTHPQLDEKDADARKLMKGSDKILRGGSILVGGILLSIVS